MWDRLTCKHCQVQYTDEMLEDISEINEITQRAVFLDVQCTNCDQTFTAAYRYDGNVEDRQGN